MTDFNHDLTLRLPVDVCLLPADTLFILCILFQTGMVPLTSEYFQISQQGFSWTCTSGQRYAKNVQHNHLHTTMNHELCFIQKTIFCPMISTGLTDGIIRTYDLFTTFNPGYFQLEILACDFAGHSTTTNVNIYILRDDQRVKIVFNEIPDLVRENQEDFVNLLSNITGAIVNLDDIQVSFV